MRRIVARACANVGLCKYWGKRGPGNVPATPSIGFALAALITETTVTPRRARRDSVALNGRAADAAARSRVIAYLDLWRSRGLLAGSFRVESVNNFPTAAGLASSSAAYAALAAALAGLAARRIPRRELSRLARLGSGSAARSVEGGISALNTGADPAARLLAKAETVPWAMVLAVVAGAAKAVGSRAGMELSRETSPFYAAWVRAGRQHYREMAAALGRWDLPRVGEIMEANMYAMHACMISTRPPLLYWEPATLAVLRAVLGWRADGLAVYATVDAGAPVAVLCRKEDLGRVASRLRRLVKAEGIAGRVIASLPGGAAEAVAVGS